MKEQPPVSAQPKARHNSMKKIVINVVIISIALFAAFYFFRSPAQKVPSNKPYVATVNNEPIDKTVYAARAKQLDYFSKWLLENHTTSSAVPNDLVDTLIDETLTLQFAKEHNLLPTQQEVEEKYQKAVASVGTEQEYLAKIQQVQGVGKSNILQRITLEITKEHIEKFTNIPFNVWLAQQKETAKIEKFATN